MTQIRATLRLNGNQAETVAFPCRDSKIKQMLAHRTDNDPHTVYVDALIEPSWMKAIEKTDVNIHEMNYLAKRMDAMDDNELAKMGAALSRFGVSNLPQSINYTFNLNRITLVRDFSNLQKVGATHYMETHGGCCTAEEYNNPRRAEEAREMLNRWDGILTDYGLLFINDEVPFEPVYNGVNFPESWYEGMDKTGVCLSYGERTEYLYCPCEDESVEFALERLVVDDIAKCGAEITCVPFGVKLGERVEGVLHNEGFHAFNAFCKRIEFLISDEQEYETLGRWWMEEQLGIDLPTELEDFFNYSGCGEYLAQESEGRFVDGIGFVGMAEDCSLEDILPAQGRGMGGMTL